MTFQEQEIFDRLQVIGAYYDLDSLLQDKTDQQAVARYYRKSDFFYNLIHSRGGHYIHMGLSYGVIFHKEDYEKQARFVGTFLTGTSMRVLEVGAGRLANTRLLAKLFPQHQFTALDLPNRNFLKNRVPANVTLVEGDYNDLSAFKDKPFDVVFGVETVCHAESKDRVIGEISKVLKPGGKLILFDVYEAKPQEEMSDFEKRVSAITLAAMRVTAKDQFIGNMTRYMDQHQFRDIDVTEMTQAIRPTLRNLDRVSCRYFAHPQLIKTLRKFISEDVTMNSIAGWLMLYTFDGQNIHRYCRIVATKA
jgi:ubiquinone/menaquinone biosynthesis C-methylase UbiE